MIAQKKKPSQKQKAKGLYKGVSSDTGIELIVRRFLRKNGIAYYKNHPRLPGKPDIVLRKNSYKTLIQIHGCYFHRHGGCDRATIPKTNIDFWKEKFEKNVERDRKKEAELKEMGWHVITIWGCELEKKKKDQTLNRLLEEIHEQEKRNTNH
jgi:DNA mismatch endonuclease (patch repair protein)